MKSLTYDQMLSTEDCGRQMTVDCAFNLVFLTVGVIGLVAATAPIAATTAAVVSTCEIVGFGTSLLGAAGSFASTFMSCF